jgi:transposase
MAKEQGLSAEQRLRFHQDRSGSAMEGLKEWLQKQLNERRVEPNSSMGKAITYMLKHWEPLTLFLRVSGAPLDNNLCEQVLKRAILHRKGSLFFKTQHGAYIGDLFMSLIHTCTLNRVNPFHYLTTLQRHSSELFKNPKRWLPWNYQQAATNPA